MQNTDKSEPGNNSEKDHFGNQTNAKTKAFFGFKEVDASLKAKYVAGVFDKVAKKYDIMNDFMSLGIHRLWKDRLIAEMQPSESAFLLDMAGGTGDIAQRFLKTCEGGKVIVADINENMLRVGKTRSVDNNILTNIDFITLDAENLPFKDNVFDYYTIAFGIRNVTNIDKALLEARRVLKTGGRFLCLEFSKVTNPTVSKIYDVFSFNVIPKLGELVASDADSYQYLVESIRKFPEQEQFKEMITKAGFGGVTYHNLSMGVAAIHSGWKF